jgi:hypothetical protein
MSGRKVGILVGVMAVTALFVPRAQAGGPWFRKGTVPPPRSVPVSTTRIVPIAPTSPAPLGTFTRTPYIMVRGNGQAGGGYTPLNQFGDASMTLYGPLSAFRMTSAPILTYTRGYDGRPVVVPGTSFSTPNFPRLTPVIYPTQASNYYGFRESGNPPWWANAINWLDQN